MTLKKTCTNCLTTVVRLARREIQFLLLRNILAAATAITAAVAFKCKREIESVSESERMEKKELRSRQANKLAYKDTLTQGERFI